MEPDVLTHTLTDDLEPTFLYRFFAADGRLLYVGITNCPDRRFRQHSCRVWWRDVATFTLECYRTRSAAVAAETVAIQEESPRHNVIGIPDGPDYRAPDGDRITAEEHLAWNEAALEEHRRLDLMGSLMLRGGGRRGTS